MCRDETPVQTPCRSGSLGSRCSFAPDSHRPLSMWGVHPALSPVLPVRALLPAPWVTAVGPLSPSQQSGSSPDLCSCSSQAIVGRVHVTTCVKAAPSHLLQVETLSTGRKALCGQPDGPPWSHLLALSPGLISIRRALPFNPLGPPWAAPAFVHLAPCPPRPG